MKKRRGKYIVLLCFFLVIVLTGCTSSVLLGEDKKNEKYELKSKKYVLEQLNGIEELTIEERLYEALYSFKYEEYQVSFNYFKNVYQEYQEISFENTGELYSWDTVLIESEMARCYLYINAYEKGMKLAEKAWEESKILKQKAIDSGEEIDEYSYENVSYVYGGILYHECISTGYENVEEVVGILEELMEEDINIYASGNFEMLAHFYQYSEDVYSEEKVIECYDRIINGSTDNDQVLRAEYKKIIALYEFGMKDEADRYYEDIVLKISEDDNRVLVSVLKNISDGKLEEAKNAVDNMQLNNQGIETNQDINRLRLAIAIEERNEENIIMYISKIVELSRLEVNTKQFKEFEEKYDLDFSEVRKSLDQDLAEYNQLELDIDLE